MPKRKKQPGRASQEVSDLQGRVAELEETLRAIRMGEVDAVLVSGPQGDQVFTLQGAEHPYRLMVETIDEGAATLADDGTVLYANRSFAQIFDVPLEKFIGAPLNDFVFGEDRELMAQLIANANSNIVRGEIRLDSHRQRPRTIRLTLSPVREQGVHTICVVATELTELIETNEALRVSELSLRQLSARLLKLQDEERRRIGRELHDGMAQTVLAVNLSLAQLRQSAQPLNPASHRALEKARELLQQMSREIRTLSYLLHPPLLDDLGLVSALKEYVNGFSERSGIETSLELLTGFRRLPQIAETAFFRITQESLANIQRHSGSRRAQVTLREDADCVALEITDFGSGMTVPSNGAPHRGQPRLGVGIPGMRERMSQLGGSLEIDSSAAGTTVRARILFSAPVLKDSIYDASLHPHRG